jgi:transaldolase/glucose-6-phosphate isomerase
MPGRAQRLFDLGQSVWLDFIRRGHMASGEFDRLVQNAGVVGVTSNPTIFQKAIGGSRDYDAGLERLMREGLEGRALLEALVIEDIQDACDRLAGVFERTRGRDGRVSIEVDPHLAHDTEGTIAEGRRLHAAVARPNLMVKVPATAAGLPAITALTAEGICVNVTLIFSLARYREVMDAWMSGLEQRASFGQAVGGIHSVASFFVSRVDSKVDAAIEARLQSDAGGAARVELEAARGRTAVANARLAYRAFRDTTASARWKVLAGRGAPPQRPLWASTSTKNPAYRDVLYVEELIGADTVNTMPPETLDAFNDHGEVEVRIDRDLAAADRLFARLPELGVPVDALIGALEQEGVVAFQKSFDALLDTLMARHRDLLRAR